MCVGHLPFPPFPVLILITHTYKYVPRFTQIYLGENSDYFGEIDVLNSIHDDLIFALLEPRYPDTAPPAAAIDLS